MNIEHLISVTDAKEFYGIDAKNCTKQELSRVIMWKQLMTMPEKRRNKLLKIK